MAECPSCSWPQCSTPYVLMGQGPSDHSPSSSCSAVAPTRQHNEKCNPAQHTGAPSGMWTGEQPPSSQLLDISREVTHRKKCCFPPGNILYANQKWEKPQTFSNFYSQQQAFHCFKLLCSSCTCPASPKTSSWNKGRAHEGSHAKARPLISAVCWCHAPYRTVMESWMAGLRSPHPGTKSTESIKMPQS